MTSAICTLVEGNYHLGLGALANSLYANGYRGTLWVGTRGALPPWASDSTTLPDGALFNARPDLQLRFVLLATTAHLTNFKPQFMLDLWTRHCPAADQLFYFDPDIVVKCRWGFFEEWASHGVALVEDVNSPIPETHPRRGAWRTCLSKRQIAVHRELREYVNGGFVGLQKAHQGFLHQWVEAMALVGEEVGGLEHSMFSFRPELQSESYPFSKTDQDALNIAAMTSSDPLSIMGREAMDFAVGGWTMSHALGRTKPWHGGFVRRALRGFPPSAAAKLFCDHVREPIPVFTAAQARRLRLSLRIGSMIGRFYHRT